MKSVISICGIFSVMLFLAIDRPAIAGESTCPMGLYKSVKQKLKLGKFYSKTSNGNIVAEACKLWPGKPGLLLAAIAYDVGVEYEKDLVVIVANARDLSIVSWHNNKIGEDAVTEVGDGSLVLDTAKYQLAEDTRAFGVRFTSAASGPSCAEGASWDELTLFIQKGERLKPVLRREMQYQNVLQGCIGSATGHDVWEYGVSTISVMKTKTNGLSDLRLTDTVMVDTNMDELPKGMTFKRRVSSMVMKYNGEKYEQRPN